MMTAGGDTKEASNGGITDPEANVNTTDPALIEESEPWKDAEQPPPESASIPVEKPKDVDDLVMKDVGDLVMNDVKEEDNKEEEEEEEEEKNPDDNAARDSPPDAVAEAGDEDNVCPIQVDATTTDSKAMSNVASIDHIGVLDHAKDHVDGQEYSIVKEEGVDVHPSNGNNPLESQHAEADAKGPDFDKVEVDEADFSPHAEVKKELPKPDLASGHASASKASTSDKPSFFWEYPSADGYESGTEEEQTAFRREVETFYRENHLEFKAPKFYKEDLNLLK